MPLGHILLNDDYGATIFSRPFMAEQEWSSDFHGYIIFLLKLCTPFVLYHDRDIRNDA